MELNELPVYHGPADGQLIIERTFRETPAGSEPTDRLLEWRGGPVAEIYPHGPKFPPGMDWGKPFWLAGVQVVALGHSGAGMVAIARSSDVWPARLRGWLWHALYLWRKARVRVWLTACIWGLAEYSREEEWRRAEWPAQLLSPLEGLRRRLAHSPLGRRAGWGDRPAEEEAPIKVVATEPGQQVESYVKQGGGEPWRYVGPAQSIELPPVSMPAGWEEARYALVQLGQAWTEEATPFLEAVAAIAEALGQAVRAFGETLIEYSNVSNDTLREALAEVMETWQRHLLFERLNRWLPEGMARWVAMRWPVTEEQVLRARAWAGSVGLVLAVPALAWVMGG